MVTLSAAVPVADPEVAAARLPVESSEPPHPAAKQRRNPNAIARQPMCPQYGGPRRLAMLQAARERQPVGVDLAISAKTRAPHIQDKTKRAEAVRPSPARPAGFGDNSCVSRRICWAVGRRGETTILLRLIRGVRWIIVKDPVNVSNFSVEEMHQLVSLFPTMAATPTTGPCNHSTTGRSSAGANHRQGSSVRHHWGERGAASCANPANATARYGASGRRPLTPMVAGGVRGSR